MNKLLPPSNSLVRDQRGFTLLEVLIAIVLLIFISLAIFQATTGAYRLRDNLVVEGDFNNGLRLAISVIERDVGMIFTPLSMRPKPTASGSPTPSGGASYSDETTSFATDPDLQRVTEFWSAAIDKSGLRPSRLQGTDRRLSFVSTSHLRVYKDIPESEFLKVSYLLEPDSSPGAIEDTMVLRRIIDTHAFELEERRDPASIKNYALLRGIKEFKWRFYSKDKQQWLTSWDSDTTEPKHNFPDLIELTVGLSGARKQSIEGTYIFKPEVFLIGIPKTF